MIETNVPKTPINLEKYLINHNIFPWIVPQIFSSIIHSNLIRSDDYGELRTNSFGHVLPPELIPFFLISMVDDCVDRRREPIQQGEKKMKATPRLDMYISTNGQGSTWRSHSSNLRE